MSGSAFRPQEARAPLFDLRKVVTELAAERQRWRESQQRSTDPGGRELPSREALAQIADGLRGVLFPMRLGPADLRQESEDFYVGHTLDSVLHSLLDQVRLELHEVSRHLDVVDNAALDARARHIVHEFSLSLPRIRALLDSDVVAAFEGDPAARSVDEVLLCYPGILAMIHHRLAHRLYALGVPLLARIVAELAHGETGIDIHPGASIGTGFFIDHGTGVVIGETAVIGAACAPLPGGHAGRQALSHRRRRAIRARVCARHPVVEDDVVIYAGATVLGRVTLGRGATIGGNVWLTHDVPPGAHITQARSLHEANGGQG